MFEPDFYCKLFNATYATSLVSPVETKSLPPGNRIVVRVEQYLKANPLQPPTEFNHFAPARYFIEHLQSLRASVSASTVDRFEHAFKTLNALLPT